MSLYFWGKGRVLRIFLTFAGSVFLFLGLSSCEYGVHEFLVRADEANDRSSRLVNLADSGDSSLHDEVKPPLINEDKFSVFIFSDIHFGRNGENKPRRYEDVFYDYFEKNMEAIQKYDGNDYPLRFSVCSGDCVEYGVESEYKIYKGFCDNLKNISTQANFKAKFPNSSIVMPENGLTTYTIAGNHDLFNSGWANWRQYCYPYISSYYFETNYQGKNLTWYFLDTGNGSLGYKQFEDLQTKLKTNNNRKVVISHYPLYAGGIFYFTMQNLVERDSLISLYTNTNVKFTMEGHYHGGGSYDYDNFHEELVKSFVDYTSFGIIYVDLENETIQIKQFDYLNPDVK